MSPPTLLFARAFHLVVGGAALLLTAGHVYGAVAGGSRFDGPIVVAGLGVGIFALAAGRLVPTTAAGRAAVAWLGIVAGVAPFVVILWIALATGSIDAIALAAVPTVLAAAAAVRLALAQAGAARRART